MRLQSAWLVVAVGFVFAQAFSIDRAFADSARLILHDTTGKLLLDHTYQTPTDVVQAQVVFANGLPTTVVVNLEPPDQFELVAGLYLETLQLHQPIHIGAYSDAQRAFFEQPNHPGLDFSLGSFGANTLTGSFIISQLSYVSPGFFTGEIPLQTLSVSFVQFGDNNKTGLVGTIDYPASIPEPSSLVLAALGLIGLAAWCLRRR
jgi:hypothetical protein